MTGTSQETPEAQKQSEDAEASNPSTLKTYYEFLKNEFYAQPESAELNMQQRELALAASKELQTRLLELTGDPTFMEKNRDKLGKLATHYINLGLLFNVDFPAKDQVFSKQVITNILFNIK